MIISVNDDDFKVMSEYIAEKCGIIIPPEKSYLIETRLSKVLVDSKLNSFGELYRYIIKNNDPALTEKIINAITTNETLWFRDQKPWVVLHDEILPKLESEILLGKKKKARIWSSACSTGQEPYSTAMCIDHYLRTKKSALTLDCFEIVATDISSRVIETARKGKYDAISIMRGMNDKYKAKYFKQGAGFWEIADNIKNSVTFEQLNLQDDFSRLGMFDVIFCRYVLIYFSEEFKKDLAARMYKSLNDNGTLFTGMYVVYDIFSSVYDVVRDGSMAYFRKGVKNEKNSKGERRAVESENFGC